MNERPLRLPSPDDSELMAAIERWVMPGRRYLRLRDGNFQRDPAAERTTFLQSLRSDAATISDAELHVLLDSEWRARLTASWLIATARRPGFSERLGGLLFESQLTYACQGFAFALARLGGPSSSEHLCAYLDEWLPRVDKRYDQAWVTGCLLHLDSVEGTRAGQAYLTDGSWDRWAEWGVARFDPVEERDRIRVLAQAVGRALE